MLVQLQELHIENQHLSDGEKMLFDDRSLQAIAVSNNVFHQYIFTFLNVCHPCLSRYTLKFLTSFKPKTALKQ